jgi:uncharacterized membrane protein
MSELIVVDYHDAQRAGEVLEALQTQHPEWSADLEDSMVFIKHADETVRLTRQRHLADEQATKSEVSGTVGKALSAEQWQEHLGLPDDFMLQVQRLIRPGDSALLMLIKANDPDLVIDAVQQFGGRVLQTPFPPPQDMPLQTDDWSHL